MLFTILKPNASKNLDFYSATVGPLSCYLLDKRQASNGTYNSMFTQANKVILTHDLTERERILDAGGEVREIDDWRVFFKG